MKTIAVLTDFSERSAHTAKYALHLAQKLRADVLLFNAFLVPDFSSAHSSIAWPAEDYDHVKAEAELKLKKLADKLKKEFEEKYLPGTWLPDLYFQCQEGQVANTIADLEDNKNIVLLVLGTHGSNNKNEFMMGNNCRQVIDAATIPLLIVPQNASLKDIEKFVFATDNSMSDVDYINSLASLARHFSAEIVVANVNEHAHLNTQQEQALHLFKKEVAYKVPYKHIFYRVILNHDVKNGLNWIIENINFDVLVMVHRKSAFYDYFLKASITNKMAEHTYLPLLVYPYPVGSTPMY